MKELNIEIEDYKLPSWNTFYSGMHWARRKKIADEAHELVKWSVYTVSNKPKLPFIQPVVIIYEISYKDKRRHDPDNAAVKLITDGLVEAGVLVDDSCKEVKCIMIFVNTGSKKDNIKVKILNNN